MLVQKKVSVETIPFLGLILAYNKSTKKVTGFVTEDKAGI
jgi:hypothetical protein